MLADGLRGVGQEFHEPTHTYWQDGVEAPSVTCVISDNGFINDQWFTVEARDRGTAVHRACHYLDEGDLDERWMQDSPHAGYVRAWLAFTSEARFNPLLIEHRVYSPLGYAGTLDRTGTLDNYNGRMVLLDIKTSATEADWWALQTAAYCGALPNPRSLHRMAVVLFPNGSYSVKEFPLRRYYDDFMDFCAALRLTQRRRARSKDGVTSNRTAA